MIQITDTNIVLESIHLLGKTWVAVVTTNGLEHHTGVDITPDGAVDAAMAKALADARQIKHIWSWNYSFVPAINHL